MGYSNPCEKVIISINMDDTLNLMSDPSCDNGSGRPVLGLRERNKAKRREAIIDSVLALLRRHALQDVTIERVAAGAEIAPATVYNLVGSREGLLVACVDRVLEQLVDELELLGPGSRPVQRARVIVDRSAEAFIADRDAYRQILSSIRDFSRSGSRLARDPAQLQIAAMRDAQKTGVLRPDVDPAAIGRQIYLSFNGALFAWAGLALTDEGFRVAARHGLVTSLAAFAADRHRAAFLDELVSLGKQLMLAGWRSN
jgi:AcrR family transcriptional regulator